jgi:hypothetical protein
MRSLVTLACASCAFATAAIAQDVMKPGPEHARIGYFAGTWQMTGEVKASPMGPGGAMSATESCEWFQGGFQMVCRGDVSGPRGPAKTGSVWTYDTVLKSYTFFGYNSYGESFYVLGGVDGKVWTWNAEMPMEGGGNMKLRAIITEESPTAYTFRFEGSPDGTTWMLFEEGRATKRGATR